MRKKCYFPDLPLDRSIEARYQSENGEIEGISLGDRNCQIIEFDGDSEERKLYCTDAYFFERIPSYFHDILFYSLLFNFLSASCSED